MVKASQSHLTSAQRRYNRIKSAKSHDRNKDQNNARRRTLYHEKKEKEAMEEACSEQQTLQSFRSRADEPDVKRHEKAVHASHSVKDVKEQEAVMNSLCAGNPRTWVDTICRNFIMRQRTEPGVAREILKSHVSKFKRILAVVVREEAALVQHAGTPKQLAYVHGVVVNVRQLVGWLEEIEAEPLLVAKYRSKTLKFFL